MLEDEAHRLHGACCFCGVPSLQRHVAQVENLAKHVESINEVSDAFAQLIQSIDGVLIEYEQFYENRKVT